MNINSIIMKKNFLIVLTALFCFATLFSSCGSKGEEQSKTISSSTVKYSGSHSDLLRVKGDIKILLAKDGDEWTVKAVIPLENVKEWSEVPDTDESFDSYFEPSMGNLNLVFCDESGAEIDGDLTCDYDLIKSLLSSETVKTETMSVKLILNNASYDDVLEIYNKISGLAIKKMDLKEVHSSSDSDYSSSSSDDDDYDADLDKAVDDYNKVLDATKKTLDAYEDLYDALD